MGREAVADQAFSDQLEELVERNRTLLAVLAEMEGVTVDDGERGDEDER